MITLQHGLFRIVLTPDSRGYVMFSLWRRAINDPNCWVPTSQTPITCEYLADLSSVNVMAMRWIHANCEEITTEEGRHLYFKFKQEESDVRTLPRES